MQYKNKKNLNISILGAGSWGGTLACLLSKKGISVNLWTPNKEEYLAIKNTKTLTKPKKYKINKNIHITMDLKSVVDNSNILVIAVPTNAFKDVINKLKVLKIKKNVILLSATKGITTDDHKRPSKIMKEVLPNNPIAVLSGPNIALDVISNTPIISVIASKNIKAAKLLQEMFSSEYFRIYTNNDVIGVESAGALKNVIAIAAGISDGLGFSISTKAALISRGLIEIAKVTVKEGGKPKTLLSAAGIGDLIATCCSTNSRNYRVGYALAKGKKLETILKELGQVAEGVETVKSMVSLAKKYKLDLPIANSVYKVLVHGKNTKSVLKDLMNRPLIGHELDF
jgi:glycerol-3-phosphate dehydrogenase (NAD(P)+)